MGTCGWHATSCILILTLLQAVAEVLHATDAVDDIVVRLVDAPANSIIQADSINTI